MQKRPNDLLLIAHSARFLAQSANRGGYSVVVLDGFADEDTRRSARSCHQTDFALMAESGSLPEATLSYLASECAADTVLAYGAGLEAMPWLVSRLAQNFQLHGNSSETVARVCHPERFFSLLDDHGIEYPETRFIRPDNPAGWLLKQAGDTGGGHVAELADASTYSTTNDCAAGRYYQRFIPGSVYSAVFLANGNNACVIGFNTQYRAAFTGVPEFTYGGAINRTDLGAVLKQRIVEIIGILVKTAGLVGLNGIDFVVANDTPLILEVNPRPTATCEFYDNDFEQGIIMAHVKACEGVLPKPDKKYADTIRAHAILYADHPLQVGEGIVWPDWVTDRPQENTRLPAAAPVCSVHAQGNTRETVEALISQRLQHLQSLLNSHRNAA